MKQSRLRSEAFVKSSVELKGEEMSKKLIRILFYVMTLLSVLMLLFTYKYVSKVKQAPLVTIEGLRGNYVLNGVLHSQETHLDVGKYVVFGESILRLYGNRVKVVKIPRFEVEVIWEK
uniref:Uncharacterized protein n=1 Tax=Fervidobacterium pennivorans TaxID=93466 RepID=A0A7V4KE93_FERPE